MKTFLSDFRELDITSLMALNGGYETYSEEPYPNPDADSPNGGSTYEARWPTQDLPSVEESINNNLNQTYTATTNDCDAWAYKVLKGAGKSVKGFYGPEITTCAQHFDRIANANSDELYDSAGLASGGGYYLGVNRGHAFLVRRDAAGMYIVADAYNADTPTGYHAPMSAADFNREFGNSKGALYVKIR